MGGLNPTTYGALCPEDGPEDSPKDEGVAAGAGFIPCVRKCLLALERTANFRVQPGYVQGYARTRQNEMGITESFVLLTSNIIMDVHVRPKPTGSISEYRKRPVPLHRLVGSPGKFFVTNLAIMHFRLFLLWDGYRRGNGIR